MIITTKQLLINKIAEQLSQKLQELNQHITATKESRDSDTKSSAGDKFETSREMAQIELNNLETQAAKTAKQLNELQQISTQTTDTISLGSLIETDKGIYFISIPFGKIVMNDLTYFAISMASPIGQLLKNKQIGQNIEFNGNLIKIERFD